jgi:tetratricopeptide (TPR) repeat protein
MHAYDRKELKRLFGLAPTTIRFLEHSGYLQPRRRGKKVAYLFSDLLILRTVGALHAAELPVRTINRALRQLKPWLSESLPMSRLSLQVRGNGITVKEGRSAWAPASGQYALPLEVDSAQAHILPMANRETISTAGEIAHDHYLKAVELEENDADAAKAAYRACLEGDRSHMEARINLGRLLHIGGQYQEAQAVYRDTAEPNGMLSFNLGVLLEDIGRFSDAILAYDDSLIHDPGLADAHFNLALLHERAGDSQSAFRHLLAYRRLMHIQDSARR